MEDVYETDIEELYWIEPFQDHVAIHKKPTTGAGLTKFLFRKDDTCQPVPIIMSATLTTNRSFDHVKQGLGISPDQPLQNKPEELAVSSPFPLEENMLWYLPKDIPAGNDPNHLSFALRSMEDIVKAYHGRSLCLFTSNKNLKAAEDYFKRVLPADIQILSQLNEPKQKIINAMRANSKTVVLGTRSFFTGIDIQGSNLSAVLIDKFPFPMQGDPIVDYLMSQPRGFYKHSLPEGIIAMKQGFGRLNRTATDKGIVGIFDGRLAAASYKNKIFNSFDFNLRTTRDWNEVQTFIDKTLEG
jgi:Rad3-related DNA helicase